MELSLKRMRDETEAEEEEVEEAEESHLGADWLATPAGTGGTCTESRDSLPGASMETYGCCHGSRAASLLSHHMMEPREILHKCAVYPTRQTHSPLTGQAKCFPF